VRENVRLPHPANNRMNLNVKNVRLLTSIPWHHHHHKLGRFLFTANGDAAARCTVACDKTVDDAVVGNAEKIRRQVNDENVLLELEVYNSLMYSCGDWSNGQNLIWFMQISILMQISIPRLCLVKIADDW
jgi:hypothetical protein